ncbi:MAG TPA: tetratricopeptide repeat protein [Gemmatimonadales bacterium]|nr:tetratricopeptide repeat protein [Gemmatimonadales bacterium]
MRRTLPVLVAVGVALGGAGCAYFNGMYNANRYARLAAQSERAGRTDEARDRWRSAAAHAESLTVHHPASRWVSDALLVEGRALVHLESYPEAVPVLERAVQHARRPEQRAEALVLLGRTNLALGRYAEARRALDAALESGAGALRNEALLFRARALLGLGLTDAALADFRASSDPHAAFELAGAEVVAGDAADAGALYEALALRRPYVEADWRAALGVLAAAGAEARAAELVDSLVGRRDLTPGERSRLLLDEASRRLAAGDTAGGSARLGAASAAAPDSVEAQVAGVRLAQLAIATASADSDLAAPRDRLQRLVLEGGTAGQDAGALLRMIALADSLGAAQTAPDAYWFLRSEVLRDSLRAPRLAAVDFVEMARRFPASPWTPKGLLAALAAGVPHADSLRALLRGRYAASPYTLVAAGESAGAEAFAALEDSLRRTLAQRGRRNVRDEGRSRLGPDIGPPSPE